MTRSLSILVRLTWLSFALVSVNAQAADTTPNPFTFTDQTGVAHNTLITSNTITVTGIDAGASISISGGQYSRNGGAFTSSKGTTYNGENIQVRHTSATAYSTTTNTFGDQQRTH